MFAVIPLRILPFGLDVTLAYLKGKDAESEEAQEHANSSSLALHVERTATLSMYQTIDVDCALVYKLGVEAGGHC
jgi:hypothetical protein